MRERKGPEVQKTSNSFPREGKRSQTQNLSREDPEVFVGESKTTILRFNEGESDGGEGKNFYTN